MGYFRPLSQTKFINDASLIGYYPFEGNSNDFSANAHNGTDTNVSYGTQYGKFAQGVNFSGAGGSRITADADSIGTGARTFAFWLKTTSAASGSLGVLDYVVSNGNNDRCAIQLTGDDSGANADKLILFTRGASGQAVYRYSGITINDGEWRHFIVTLDVANVAIKIYVNGVLNQSAQTGTTLSSIDSLGTMVLGATFDGSLLVPASMDDLGMFSKVFTDAEAAELYQSATLGEYLGAGSAITKLLCHFNGSSADSSGSGNNGTDVAITYSQANGKLGQGAGFNGSTSWISCPTIDPAILTVSVWINVSVFGVDQKIISRASNNAWNNPFGWYLTAQSGAPTNFTFLVPWGTSANNLVLAVTSTAPSTGIWYNVVGTYDGYYARIYLNGELNGISSAVTGAPKNIAYASAETVAIGRRSGFNADGYFTGSMDELIVENTAWSAEKIKKYYTYSKGRFGIL